MTRTPAHPPPTPTCYSSVTGAPILEAPTVPTLDAGLAELMRYAIARSDSAATAASILGLRSPVALRELCRRHKVRIPKAWTRRKGGR